MGDCNTAVCAECLINRKQAYKWDLGDRFRESAGGFFPFVFWFFYSKHISCWRGAEYGPAVSHAGTRVILSWRAPRRSRAGRASCLSLCLSELRLRPAPDRAASSHGCVMVGGPTAAPLRSLWAALSTSEASGPVPSLSSGYCRGLSSLTANGPCFYGGPVSTKLVYHLLTSYVSQLQTSQRIQKGSFCYPCSLVQLGGSPGCGWEILGPLRRTSQGSESLRQSPGSLPAGSVEVRVGKVLF